MNFFQRYLLFCSGLSFLLVQVSVAQTAADPYFASKPLPNTSMTDNSSSATQEDSSSLSPTSVAGQLQPDAAKDMESDNNDWMVNDLLAMGLGLYNVPQEEDLQAENTPYHLAYDADLTYFKTRQFENWGIQTGANVSDASVKRRTKATLYAATLYFNLRYGYGINDTLRIYGMSGPTFFNSVLKFKYGRDRRNTGLGWNGGGGLVWGGDQFYIGLQVISFARTGEFGTTTIAGTTKIADGSNQVQLLIYYWR